MEVKSIPALHKAVHLFCLLESLPPLRPYRNGQRESAAGPSRGRESDLDIHPRVDMALLRKPDTDTPHSPGLVLGSKVVLDLHPRAVLDSVLSVELDSVRKAGFSSQLQNSGHRNDLKGG